MSSTDVPTFALAEGVLSGLEVGTLPRTLYRPFELNSERGPANLLRVFDGMLQGQRAAPIPKRKGPAQWPVPLIRLISQPLVTTGGGASPLPTP